MVVRTMELVCLVPFYDELAKKRFWWIKIGREVEPVGTGTVELVVPASRRDRDGVIRFLLGGSQVPGITPLHLVRIGSVSVEKEHMDRGTGGYNMPTVFTCIFGNTQQCTACLRCFASVMLVVKQKSSTFSGKVSKFIGKKMGTTNEIGS